MARRAMRDHQQDEAWPPRPLPAVLRQEAIDLAAMMRACDAEVDAAGEEIEAVLRDLTEQELAELDPSDPRLVRRTASPWINGRQQTVGGSWMLDRERRRRAALTGHERILENRERLRRRAAS